MIKFRSMVVDAEKATGAVWSSNGDSRITLMGKFLRKTRLDELPQIINVLKGEMSMVGPRPERPNFVGRLGTGVAGLSCPSRRAAGHHRLGADSLSLRQFRGR